MDGSSRRYPYDKRIMLNVLYDTLDNLGFKIERSNSERGTIIAASKEEKPKRVRIACGGVLPEGRETEIKIYPEPGSEAEGLGEIILDEMDAMVKRSLRFSKTEE